MKVFGYVRDENGCFENRKEQIIKFSKLMNLKASEIICEKSSADYNSLSEIKRLLGCEKDFVLLVSDASDLFEDEYSRMKLCKTLEERNVFLIDTYYPNLDYRMITEEKCKESPTYYLANSMIVMIETYLRKKNADIPNESIYSDMRMRFEEWKTISKQ